MAQVAIQSDELVEWGWWQLTLRANPMPTNPITIRNDPRCYKVDSEQADVDCDVLSHPEYASARSIRFVFGRLGHVACLPRASASHRSDAGHRGQSGPFGVQTVAPSSIIAWL